ncbi:unnamed protein product [Peronospora belbahrii]|uniref:Uncharacterized protein n=1 Tax=Peronospora belbahrii TaxID=622444 RepID=A0AAU9L5P2_9STRA|nr:unnamed protein product [Peronospora belbahrii]CAH0513886.1 unnamed protein product [Peronospora belbahrii]
MENVNACSGKAVSDEFNEDTAKRKEEMPLLFMDELPSIFQQNAELAAIATFMDSEDEEADDDDEASWSSSSSKPRQQKRDDTLMKVMRQRRRQQPYAKLSPKDRNKNKRDEAKTSDTKELQLFMSMFHVS